MTCSCVFWLGHPTGSCLPEDFPRVELSYKSTRETWWGVKPEIVRNDSYYIPTEPEPINLEEP